MQSKQLRSEPPDKALADSTHSIGFFAQNDLNPVHYEWLFPPRFHCLAGALGDHRTQRQGQ
jgi:hypothetical protein